MTCKVFVMGGEHDGWALDIEVRLLKSIIKNVEFTNLAQADVVHSVWWEPLSKIHTDRLAGKKIICQFPGEPARYYQNEKFRQFMPTVGLWITQTKSAQRQFAEMGFVSEYMPYPADLESFYPVPNRTSLLNEKYVIGNFHRDTEWDLRSPRLEKGPDIFCSIVEELYVMGIPIHILLAGPRRHYIRNRFKKIGVPYTYIGEETDAEDYPSAILSSAAMNRLYHTIDLYLITSRSEGGPRAILEAASTKTPILTTDVGLAEIVHPMCVYTSPQYAAARIVLDYKTKFLSNYLDAHFDTVNTKHNTESAWQAIKPIYENLNKIPRQ